MFVGPEYTRVRVLGGLALLLVITSFAGCRWGLVPLRSDAEPLQTSTQISGIEIGDWITGGWRVVGIESGGEYVRFELEGLTGRTVVEVVGSNGSPSAWRTEQYAIQPGPGTETPVQLLDAFHDLLVRLEASDEHTPFVVPAEMELGYPLLSQIPQAHELRAGGGGLLRDVNKTFHRWLGHSREYGGMTPIALGVLVVFLLFVLAGTAMSLRKRRENPRPGRPNRDLAYAGAVAILAFLYLFSLAESVPLHGDTVRDLFIARDCLDGNPCIAGPPASMASLVQGTLWQKFLAAALWVGLDLRGIQLLVLLSHAGAVGLMFLAGSRARSPATGLLIAFAVLWDPSLVRSGTVLWNPSLFPLALAFFTLAAFKVARTGRSVDGLVAVFLLALALEVHLQAIGSLPVLLLIIAMSGWGGLLCAPFAAAVFLSLHAVSSPISFRTNVLVVLDLLGWPAMIALLASLILAGGLLGGVWRAWGEERRVRAAAILWSATYLAGAAIASATAANPLEWRYVQPVIPFVAFLAADGLSALYHRLKQRRQRLFLFSRRLAVATALVAVAMHWVDLRSHEQLTVRFSDMEELAHHLIDLEYEFDDLVLHLHGTSGTNVLAGLAYYMPEEQHAEEAGATRGLLLAVRSSGEVPDRVPDSWRVFDWGRFTGVLIYDRASWLDHQNMTVCYRLLDEEEQVCYPATGRPSHGTFRWGNRSPYDLVPGPLDAVPEPSHEVTYVIPIQIRDTDRWHAVHVLAPKEPFHGPPRHDRKVEDSLCVWRIVAIEGIPYRTELPTTAVVLENDSTAVGMIALSRLVTNECRLSWPDVVETAESEGDIRELFDLGPVPGLELSE